eukprot:1141944-Pelagomonas_calceolata.AAC.4
MMSLGHQPGSKASETWCSPWGCRTKQMLEPSAQNFGSGSLVSWMRCLSSPEQLAEPVIGKWMA